MARHCSKDSLFAAEMDACSGELAVAAVYAEALLGAAETADSVDLVLVEYRSLLLDIFDDEPQLEELLASPVIPPHEKIRIIDRAFRGQLADTLVNFLKVAARRGRLGMLRLMYWEFRRLVQTYHERAPIYVTTATPIDSRMARKIAQDLSGIVEGQPLIQRDVDPDLIGGAVVRVGDRIYDASIATQLKHARQQMIDRSVHEIQSRRDRFRNTSGN